MARQWLDSARCCLAGLRRTSIFLSLCVTLPISLIGCAHSQNQEGFYSYGNFCGLGHPDVRKSDVYTEAQLLQEIPALDQLDAICKAHDICYATNGYFQKNCDENFIRSVRVTRFRTGNCIIFASMLGRIIARKISVETTSSRIRIRSIPINPFLPIDMAADRIRADHQGFQKPRVGEC